MWLDLVGAGMGLESRDPPSQAALPRVSSRGPSGSAAAAGLQPGRSGSPVRSSSADCLFSPQTSSTGEEALAAAVRCYDDLSRLLWGLDGLPLTVSAVQGAHPVLRYTEVRSREPLPLGDTPLCLTHPVLSLPAP